MCSGYLRRNSNVRVDMTVQTRKLDGALRDEFKKTRRAQVRDFVHIYIDFRYAGAVFNQVALTRLHKNHMT